MTTTQSSPRVYVGTYSKYNNGSLNGGWIDLDGHDKQSFLQACQELHKDEHDPEIMFQDYEGFPQHFYNESYLPDELWDWLALDENDRQLLHHYHEAGLEGDIGDARDRYLVSD